MAVAALRLKRAYEAPSEADGTRVLVERLWPRGMTKEAAALDLWLKEVAPSGELRRWYGHDPARWAEFRRRYEAELRGGGAAEARQRLEALCREGRTVTLVFAARDEARNSAVVLRDVLEERLGHRHRHARARRSVDRR